MINVGIIGSNGMLGSDLKELLAAENNYYANCYDFPEFDITNSEDITKIIDANDIIVNCAAYTAVDAAESNIADCYSVNSEAVGKLGVLTQNANKYLIHISTDFVFGDKSDSLLTENSPTNPLNIYGESKLEGEKLLLKLNSNYAIIRVQWTYGKHGNHFISKIIDLTEKFNSLKIVDDQVGSPTCTEDVAKAILCFIKKRPVGLYHFAANNYASRYETAKFVTEELKLKTKLNPCTSEEFPAPAQRPKNSRFDCSKIDEILEYERPTWQESLSKFLFENYK